MSMVVRTNSMAMSANSALNKNNSTVAGNLQKLSTGFRINRAADDASGLAVSEKMKAQIKALDQAGKNAQDGASLIKTAEGYMGEVHDMLNRIVELAEKSANGTFETVSGGIDAEDFGKAGTDRQAIQDEVDQLTSEIDRIATTANFNQLKLMDGNLSSKMTADDITKANTELAKQAKTGAAAVGDVKSVKLYAATTGADGTVNITELTEANSKTADAILVGKTVITTAAADASGDTPAVTEKTATTYETYEGGSKGGLKLQIGETSTSSDSLTVNVRNFKTSSLFATVNKYVNGDGDSYSATKAEGNKDLVVHNDKSENAKGLTINVSNQDAAAFAAEAIRSVINEVSSQRATLGAMENRLDYTMNNLDTASQNITDANSRIRDTDMAKTMMQYTQGNTLTQAAQAMLAQANQAPSQVLQLLQ